MDDKRVNCLKWLSELPGRYGFDDSTLGVATAKNALISLVADPHKREAFMNESALGTMAEKTGTATGLQSAVDFFNRTKAEQTVAIDEAFDWLDNTVKMINEAYAQIRDRREEVRADYHKLGAYAELFMGNYLKWRRNEQQKALLAQASECGSSEDRSLVSV